MTNLELFCPLALLKIFFKNINMNKRPLDSIPMMIWLFKGYEKRIGHLSMVMKTRGEAHIIFTLFLAAFLRSLQSMLDYTVRKTRVGVFISSERSFLSQSPKPIPHPLFPANP